jgi:hypothetical protein
MIQSNLDNLLLFEFINELGPNNLNISEVIETCIQDEFRMRIDDAARKIHKNMIAKKLKASKVGDPGVRFTTLNLLTQAYVNILILSKNQSTLVETILKQKQIQKVIKVLLHVDSYIFNFKRSDWAMKHNFCHFLNFIAHGLRLLIVCQTINHQSLLQVYDEEGDQESCVFMMTMLVRRYSKFVDFLPQNSPLLEVLSREE